MVEGFRDTTDALVVVQSSAKPNYQQITVSLLSELVELQRAAPNVSSVSSPSQRRHDRGLGSLGEWTLACAARFRQPLSSSQFLSSNGSRTIPPHLRGHRRVLERQFRFTGLNQWKVPVIVGLLPTLLHMFLAGLTIFVWSMDLRLGAVIIAIGGSLVLLHILSKP